MTSRLGVACDLMLDCEDPTNIEFVIQILQPAYALLKHDLVTSALLRICSGQAQSCSDTAQAAYLLLMLNPSIT
jgi:hypothetical protein